MSIQETTVNKLECGFLTESVILRSVRFFINDFPEVGKRDTEKKQGNCILIETAI